MTRDFDIALDKVRVASAVDSLAGFYGLRTSRDIAEILALRDVQGLGSTATSSNLLTVSTQTAEAIKTLLDVSDGAMTSKQLADYIASVDNQNGEYTIRGNIGTINIQAVNSLLPQEISNTVNQNINSPTKEQPGLSFIVIKDAEALIANNNGNQASIVLNGIPTIEWSKAISFVKLTFMFGRDAINNGSNRIQTMSLSKFFDGAKELQEGNEIERLLVDVNTTPGTIEGSRNSTGEVAIAGLELFTTPQTLVNANERFDPSKRAVPVIDKFRPFLSLKELTIDVSPASAGMISYKVAKLTMVLQDRARMAEIAEFIKPDMYGATEIMLEYGWSHPDKPFGTNVLRDNPYGTIINGLRSKEKYGIRNSSFTFMESGKVGITLDLFMKGGNECLTETIAGSEFGVNNVLRDIDSIVRLIRRYERQTFGQQTESTREIRGQQIFQAANDYQSNLRLTPGVLSALREMTTTLNRASAGGRGRPASRTARELRDQLQRMFANRTSNGNSEGELSRLYTTTQQSIQNKINSLLTTPDPFLNNLEIPPELRGRTRRDQAMGNPPRNRAANQTISNRSPRVNTAQIVVSQPSVSLGKLILMFVGQPLAATKRFDDVQILFYPFNAYAGFANSINISQFKVDTRFFVEQFTRYRTENASRAANISLSEFMQFISATIIDDPAAISYGLSDLYYESRDPNTGETSVRAIAEAATFQTQLQNRLRNRTPDATFRMPRVDFYIESSPGKTLANDSTIEVSNEKTILRIHIFDRVASKYEAQMNILASAREDTLLSISSIPENVRDGEAQIVSSYRATHERMRELAAQETPPLIVPLNNQQNTSAGRVYTINGGPKAIKDFIMKTMPYIIYGIEGSAIIGQPNLSSMQNAELSTVNMIRSLNTDPITPNGEQPGGIPLSVLPCDLNMTTFGCPILRFGQQFFVDFQTGVTADNVYGITGLSHKFTDKRFTSDIKFVPIDAYGRYSSFVERINQAAARIQD